MQLQFTGQLLQQRRLFLKLSQDDVAELSGITPRTVYAIENGKANPSLNTIQKMAAVLGMELVLQVKNMDNG